jgi:hypothetical protein
MTFDSVKKHPSQTVIADQKMGTVFKSVALRFSWFLLVPFSTVESRVYYVHMLTGVGTSLLLSSSWLANG